MAQQQKHVKKVDTNNKGVDESKDKKPKQKSEKEKKNDKDLEKLLDEIDDLIKEQGEDFVKNYVQRGGE
ncbi:MAG: ubiquitin-like protein Pup [Candidatus Azambacteria bacterium]|nr:ubiquitin-like protein Pup [Candidatus Azambacteria bacterium]